jgi:hypothetical protein
MTPKKPAAELAWDATIEDDGNAFQVLPDGEYPFRVVSMEKGRFEGSGKLPACNMAKVTIEVGDAEGPAVEIIHRLYLHTITEGLLCQFFRSVGARKSGQKLPMDWPGLPGKTGRCKVTSREWTNKDGKALKFNQVDRFIDPPEGGTPPPFKAPAAASVGTHVVPEESAGLESDDIPF